VDLVSERLGGEVFKIAGEADFGSSEQTYSPPNDPLTTALKLAGARKVDANSVGMVTWDAVTQTPRLHYPFGDKALGYTAWKLDKRKAADGKEMHGYHMGIRLGKTASGKWSELIPGPGNTPPAVRKVNFREALMLLESPLQLGLPATIETDACLGWAVYAYQSAEVLLERCERAKEILVRIVGSCSKGHMAVKREVTQRAKVGYCPCCTVATHILIPPSYAVGRFDQNKYRGLRLWQSKGPWASRSLAAALYANNYGGLSPTWDWVAESFKWNLPSALLPVFLCPQRRNSVPALMDWEAGEDLEGESSSRPRGKPPPPIFQKGASPSPAKAAGMDFGMGQGKGFVGKN